MDSRQISPASSHSNRGRRDRRLFSLSLLLPSPRLLDGLFFRVAAREAIVLDDEVQRREKVGQEILLRPLRVRRCDRLESVA